MVGYDKTTGLYFTSRCSEIGSMKWVNSIDIVRFWINQQHNWLRGPATVLISGFFFFILVSISFSTLTATQSLLSCYAH